MSVEVITQIPKVFWPDQAGTRQQGASLSSGEAKGEWKGATFAVPGSRQKPVLFEMVVNQNHSSRDSLDQFIARRMARGRNVQAVYRQKLGDSLCFYTVTVDEDDDTVDALIEAEQEIYRRFSEIDVEFHILLGKDSENLLPSGAISLLSRA